MDTQSIDKTIQQVTRSTSTVDTATETDSTTGQTGFDTMLRSILSPSSGSSINEEELFAALLQERLDTKVGSNASAEYKTQLDFHKGAMARNDGYVPVEDAANEALADLVTSGTISQAQADEIKGEAFQAAQLDSNTTALFDGRGSADDATIATADAEAAMASALAIISQIESGAVAPSGVTPPVADAPVADAPDSQQETQSTTPEGNNVDGTGGFVFKPESEHEKKLVILLPTQFANTVEDVLLKDENDNIVERGRSSGFANGGREHFRFNRAGQDYPQNITVEVRMTDGSIETYEIPNPAERYD